ncbi:MAG: hypothetical protein ACKESB_01380 [Candidatus Hodgkinia cicadicola]
MHLKMSFSVRPNAWWVFATAAICTELKARAPWMCCAVRAEWRAVLMLFGENQIQSRVH